MTFTPTEEEKTAILRVKEEMKDPRHRLYSRQEIGRDLQDLYSLREEALRTRVDDEGMAIINEAVSYAERVSGKE